MEDFCGCFAGPLQFSLSTVKQTKLFHSISEMFFIFLRRKTLWEKLFSSNVCKAGLSKLEEKAGILARNSHTSLASDWTYHFSHMWKNIVRDSDWMYHYFFFTCENHSSLLWLAKNSFAYQNLQHNFLVSISQYVYNKFLYWHQSPSLPYRSPILLSKTLFWANSVL